ncbi:histidine phosphatase family protein [Teichococcus rhizosphaerae]|nr:histidine phosphatase family protein [Pseudoroseomonas rhizosphaerae]
MRVALVRHLPTDLPPGLCYGRLDPPPRRGADAAPLRAALSGFGPARWLCSPAQRCRALAGALAEGALITEDARLLELDFGEWEGRAWNDVPRAALDAWAADPWGFAPPGGESGAALVARLRAFHADLRAAAPRKNCVVVAHGGPLKVLADLLAGHAVELLAPAQPMGSLRILEAR